MSDRGRWNPRAMAVGIGLSFGLSTHVASLACDTPVYRYALENWAAADYELLLIKVGVLSDAEEAAWKQLADVAGGAPARPNVRLRATTPEQLAGPAYQAVLASLGDARHSRLALLSPEGPAPRRIIWQGDCTRDSAEVLFQSPARQEIGRRLLDGDAAVWVWVSPAKESRDGESARLQVENTLAGYGVAADEAAAAQSLVVPAESNATSSDAKSADATPPLPLRFSVLRVAADDPREAVFLNMLRGVLPESSAATEAAEPTAFPVFGQGRVLAGIAMRTLDARTTRSACDFLTGACSCEIKDKNPGLDLLMVADWGSVKPQSAPTQLFSLLALEPETPDATPAKSPQQGASTTAASAVPSGVALAPVASPRATEGESAPVAVARDSDANAARSGAAAHSEGSDGPATSGPAVTRVLLWSGLAVILAAGILMAIVWRFTARV